MRILKENIPIHFRYNYFINFLAWIKKTVSTPLTRRVYAQLRLIKRDLNKAFHDSRRDEYCGIYVNWSFPPDRWDNMKRIHWHYSEIQWKDRKIYLLAASFIFPFLAGFFAAKRTRQYGHRLKMHAGINLWRQFVYQIYLATKYFLSPSEYYSYNMFEEANRKRASMYVLDHEILPLMESLQRSIDLSVFDDKRRFYQKCKKYRLPTIAIIAEFENGKIKAWHDTREKHIPQTDVIAKPACGRCGHGILLYTYEGPASYCNGKGANLDHIELINHIADHSLSEPYIVQERIFNHPDLTKYSNGALCTCRVVTGRAPGKQSEFISSILKLPTKKNITDNYVTGGLAVPIEFENGKLGAAVQQDYAGKRLYAHPDTGNVFIGSRIPYWRSIVELCLCAHDLFSEFAFVGWDVAVTEDGPVLVEGNVRWGVKSMQSAHNAPLGLTRFPEIFISHLESKGPRK
jgi:hypothetical protein